VKWKGRFTFVGSFVEVSVIAKQFNFPSSSKYKETLDAPIN
jgi:hypothetical protein